MHVSLLIGTETSTPTYLHYNSFIIFVHTATVKGGEASTIYPEPRLVAFAHLEQAGWLTRTDR